MLIFITSLKHPKVTKNIQKVYEMLDRALQSIENQTNKDFLVIIVCHEIPVLKNKYKFVHYLITNLKPPAQTSESLIHEDNESVQESEKKNDLIRLDRGRKYLAGLYFAKKFNPTHIMFFDADDCISSKIVETVVSNLKEKSWMIDKWYIWEEGHKFIIKTKNFHKICGTCFIYSISIFNKLPANENKVKVNWYKNFLGGHVNVPWLLERENIILSPLPYYGAVYVINNWENHSANKKQLSFIISRKKILFWLIELITSVVYLSKKIKKDFNLK